MIESKTHTQISIKTIYKLLRSKKDYKRLYLARVDGVEPSHNGVKVRCLNHLATPSLAPGVGLEPTTSELTVPLSTIEISRNGGCIGI